MSVRERLTRWWGTPLAAGLSHGLITALAAIAGIAFLYGAMEVLLLGDLRAQLRQIAVTSAALTDVPLQQKILRDGKADDDTYARAVRPLERLLASNPDIIYAWTGIIRGNTVYYLTDGDVTAGTRAFDPDVEPPMPGERRLWRTGEIWVDERPTQNSWGPGLRAFVPLRGDDGGLFAYLGVTMRAERYQATMTGLFRAALVGAVSGLLIAPLTTVYYDTGFLIGLKGFVAAIVGALASYPLAVAAAVGVGIVEAFASFWASSFKEVIVFTAILPVLLIRSLASPANEDEE